MVNQIGYRVVEFDSSKDLIFILNAIKYLTMGIFFLVENLLIMVDQEFFKILTAKCLTKV